METSNKISLTYYRDNIKRIKRSLLFIINLVVFCLVQYAAISPSKIIYPAGKISDEFNYRILHADEKKLDSIKEKDAQIAYTFEKAAYRTFVGKESKKESLCRKIADLQKQADKLYSIARKIKAASVNRSPVEKKVMMEETKDLLKDAVEVQALIAELSAQLRQDNYDKNKKDLTILISRNKNGLEVYELAQIYMAEAEKAWKTGKKMLEEAYAEESKEARVGAMGNAEEKEILAIDNQTKAIMLFNSENNHEIIEGIASY